MFEVIKAFRDAKNDNHFYDAGDTYPVPGYKPTEAGLKEIAKGKNKYGVAFLKEVADSKGGGGRGNPENDKAPDLKGGDGTLKE